MLDTTKTNNATGTALAKSSIAVSYMLARFFQKLARLSSRRTAW